MKHVIEKGLPFINAKILETINETCDGNISMFCRKIGLANSSKVNRLFKRDKRNNEYPKPSIDLIKSITDKFFNENDWFLEKKDAHSHVNNITIDANRIEGNNNITESSDVGTFGYDYIEIIKKQQAQIDALMKIITSNGK